MWQGGTLSTWLQLFLCLQTTVGPEAICRMLQGLVIMKTGAKRHDKDARQLEMVLNTDPIARAAAAAPLHVVQGASCFVSTATVNPVRECLERQVLQLVMHVCTWCHAAGLSAWLNLLPGYCWPRVGQVLTDRPVLQV